MPRVLRYYLTRAGIVCHEAKVFECGLWKIPMPSNWRQYLDIHTLPPANKDIINIRMYQYPLKRSVFRTRPKVKPKENSWKRTAYRRSAKLGRIHYLDITISIPLGMQPVAIMHCGRYATPSRLIFYEAIRLLPNYSNLTA